MSTRLFTKSVIIIITFSTAYFWNNSAWSQSTDYLEELSIKCYRGPESDQAACEQLRQACERQMPQVRTEVEGLEKDKEYYNNRALEYASRGETSIMSIQMVSSAIRQLSDAQLREMQLQNVCHGR